ncbi:MULTISPECIES: sensor histidine kinase [Actinomadura]|uniref:histidine kinase n=1 Tax=Actinomadura yumaensis TaxID=111807 RepID=A0ABW2CG80_9ACTN|nr:HAMP domain-containing sensor histidine kinase [Actinomadura sp. J1-007]MWK34439.1 HAMP domain-containing protein [Actinomadura sp. J1-007]
MRFGSVRARTTAGATAVVAVALVVAGLVVVQLLRANLAGQADLRAEVAAREVAAQLAGGTPFGKLDLPDGDDHPAQVVGDHGTLLAASDDLKSITGTGTSAVRPAPSASSTSRPDGGGGDDDDDDDPKDDPERGEVSSDPDYSTGTADVDGRTGDYRFAALEVTTPAGRTVTVYAGSDLEGARTAVGAVVRGMLAGLPVLLVVVALVTWLVTRRALRPVDAISAGMAEITGSGDLARRVPEPGSRDEVARLAATTNATLAALERSVARQRGFVADASHELRSPIASLRTQLEVAAAHPELLDLDGVVDDVVRLQHLAADLLLLARLDAGERPAGSTPVALGDVVREEVGRHAGARVPIETQITAEPLVAGSASRLSRALGNLLDNAERHASSAVRVTLDERGGQAVIRVTDDGPGVPPDERERIFDRFVRLDAARARDEGGAGLGLAIARDLAAAHGGTLVAGEAPGGGACFEIRLPADRIG